MDEIKKFKMVHDLKEIENKRVVEIIQNENGSMVSEPSFMLFEDGSMLFINHQKSDEESDKKFSEVFHTLWSKAIKCYNYDKKEWTELWGFLQSRGINL